MKLKCFGIIKDLVDSDNILIDTDQPTSVESLRIWLSQNHTSINTLSSYMIAVNQEYAENNQVINAADEIALIPPVSGG